MVLSGRDKRLIEQVTSYNVSVTTKYFLYFLQFFTFLLVLISGASGFHGDASTVFPFSAQTYCCFKTLECLALTSTRAGLGPLQSDRIWVCVYCLSFRWCFPSTILMSGHGCWDLSSNIGLLHPSTDIPRIKQQCRFNFQANICTYLKKG